MRRKPSLDFMIGGIGLRRGEYAQLRYSRSGVL